MGLWKSFNLLFFSHLFSRVPCNLFHLLMIVTSKSAHWLAIKLQAILFGKCFLQWVSLGLDFYFLPFLLETCRIFFKVSDAGKYYNCCTYNNPSLIHDTNCSSKYMIQGIHTFDIWYHVRRLEMSLRRRDVEQWMSHRHLPDDLRRYKSPASLSFLI